MYVSNTYTPASGAGAGAAGHPAASTHAPAGPPPEHALLLPGPHLRLLRRHEDPGAQLRPHCLHEPHVRPVRVRAGGRHADGRQLSLPEELLSEEPPAGVHAGADPVRAVGGHVHAAVGRVHAWPQPARLPGHGGASAEGTVAGAALRLHGDGPRRRRARQAGRRGAARRRADGGRRRRRHLRRGHRGSQGGLGTDRPVGPMTHSAAQGQHRGDLYSETSLLPLPVDAEKLHSPTAQSDRGHAPPKPTNFVMAELHRLPVVRIGDMTAPLHSSLIAHFYSLGKPTSPTADNSNTTHISNAADNHIGNKSEGLLAAFLSHLRGAEAHSGTHVSPSGTVTNVVKNNTFTKTVLQHIAHAEHSNQTLNTVAEHPTLSNATKTTTKLEQKTVTASKIYAQFEAHNSTVHEYSDTVHAATFPPVQNITRFSVEPLKYQKNSATFAIFSAIGKPNNPLSIMLPLLHTRFGQLLKTPLRRNNSPGHLTLTFPCSHDSFETGDHVKCLKQSSASVSDTLNKTNETANGNSALHQQHVRVKRSSDVSPAHILDKSAGESSRHVQSHAPDGSGVNQHSVTDKYPPPEPEKAGFPAEDARRRSDGQTPGRLHTGRELLLSRDFQLEARQAWGSMLGVMWCAAGVIFSGPSFWNVMACLLQAGQAFFG